MSARVLPGHPHRPHGRRAAAAVRLRARPASRRTRTSTSLDRTEAERRSADPRQRDRAAPGRADARHRRHHPARAGRDRPRRVDETVCVQGAPGTGKTAVGLHRAAYLLYAHRDRLRRGGVLVVGPNRAFLVLHRRGAAGARRGRRAAGHPRRAGRRACRCGGRRGAAVAVLKGDARMADGPATARCTPGWSRPTEALVVPRGSRRWRVAGVRADRDRRRAAATATSGTARPGPCSRSGSRTRCYQDGGGRRVAGRPGAGRGGAQRAGPRRWSTGSGRRSTRSGSCCGC